jgi:hypothetical protein
MDSMSLARAVDVLKHEIQNHLVAVVAECGYRLCQLASLRAPEDYVAAVNNVCSLASDQSPAATGATLVGLPSTLQYMSDHCCPKQS